MKRNLLITLIATTISVILCTLGFSPSSQPIDSIAVIWPGAILHSVGSILFGGWGIIATVLSGILVDVINVGTWHAIIGYALPDFLQAFIPAVYYRMVIKKYGWGPETFRFIPYFVFAVLLSNFAGALMGTAVLYSSSKINLWLPFSRWLVANIPISLILGWPLLKCLGPTLAEEGFAVKGWWR